jgi:hypothetical protein
MKYVKMLALAAVAASALMAFIGAGTASASTICSTTADPCPEVQKWPKGEILDFSLEGSALLKETSAPGGEGKTLDTCKSSTVKGEITNAGSATQNVTGKITELTWGTCTFPTKTLEPFGGLELKKVTGTSNGTVIADGETKVTINTILFGSCVYTVSGGETIGDVTEGNPAVFHANAVARRTSGSAGVCPETSNWTATYVLTTTPGTTFSVDAG